MIFDQLAVDPSGVITRFILPELIQALADRPVVFLAGPRQCGKSTLVRHVSIQVLGADYLTFDDLGTLTSARADPEAFVRNLPGPIVIDEVQRVPEVLLPIKASVDRDRRPGRFLLTGSASLSVTPQIALELVGRVEVLPLRPFAQAEIEGGSGNLVDALFAGSPLTLEPGPRTEADLARRIRAGGFPEAVGARRVDRREAWFASYVAMLLQREVRDLAQIERLPKLPDLTRLVAARTATLSNHAELARATQLPQTTLNRYLALLEGVHLCSRVPAWSTNLGKRVVKSPKLFLLDSGLATHLVGAGETDPTTLPEPRGQLLETFVFGELERLASWSRTKPRIHHYRTHTGQEVDFVLEDRAGRCVTIEVKAQRRIDARDLEPMKTLARDLGARFVRGIVLHMGDLVLPMADRIQAVPVQALWQQQA